MKKRKTYDFNCSYEVLKLCKLYRVISNIAWIIVLFALIEPRILVPAFCLSLLVFLNRRVKISYKTSIFL